ncbi:DUF3223 domain-containing protein [Sinorhizobium medicae]|uniref:DUF3223 domain-containing protein n=1 Tax=Sinorhizobium medicae TaxID=110321 RepID=A0A508X3B1_9HYPH|nr:DUF3223 domain-containing protein [Sinorhizobium medicae]VTZ62312.1 hypothetical protein EMEDMD4_370176 [Sinorhizobium medicae]
MPVKIGSESFRTKKDAIRHCRAILYRQPLETEIEGEDAEFVHAVFNLRTDKVAELGTRTIVRFLRKLHRHNTPGFFAELSDGTFLDFSFMKAINTLPRASVAGGAVAADTL